MSVRQRALARLDRPVHDLKLAGADILGADQPAIAGTRVIGRMVGRHVTEADEIARSHSCIVRH